MEASRATGDRLTPGVHSFKNLEFWKLARQLAVDSIRMSRRFPKDDATRVLTRQFVASVSSIGANIAEGHGRFSRAAYRNHLSIARGSAAETENWIDLFAAIELLSPQEEQDYTNRCHQIIASLTRAMQRLSADIRAGSSQIREESAIYDSEGDFGFEPPDGYFDDEAPMLTSSHARENEDEPGT
jgi:four helix bundle protein